MKHRKSQHHFVRYPYLALLYVFRTEGSDSSPKVVGTVLCKERGELSVQPGRCPGFRNSNHTGGVFLHKRAKIFDVTGKNDASRRNCQLIDQAINHTVMM